MRVELDDIHTASSLVPRGQTSAVEVVRTSSGCRHVFKRYKNETRAGMRMSSLLELTDWERRLSTDDRTWLHTHGSWIRHVVYEQGEPIGVLIPIAAHAYWTLKGEKNVPRDGSRLLDRSDKGESFNLPSRLHAIGELLATILWFHERGVVVGDIQLSNFLVGSRGQVFLIDLDSAWINGKCAFPITENLRYSAPFDEGRHTIRTDLYKFSLIATKVLSLNAAALDTSLCSPSLASYQSGILADLHRGVQHDSSTLNSLARNLSKCAGGATEYVFSPDAVNRVPSSGPPSRIRQGEAPLSDHCSGKSRKPAVAQSGRNTPVVRPPAIPVNPKRKNRWDGAIAITILAIAGLTVFLILWFIIIVL